MTTPKPAPAPAPDPLKGIDAQKWAKEFMRIWSGRWSEVDEGLMIGWFANAIMRGFDEGQRRLRKQHGCELPPLAEPKPSAPPAPEPMPCGICKGMGFYNTVYRDRIRCPNLCGDPNPILPTKAPEPKQWSEEPIPEEALHIAAQAWCDSETSDRIMDPPLAIAFAKRLAPYLALRAELAQAREEIAAIKRQAEDATEYVLAVDNRELRKEIEGLRIRVGEYEDMTEINKRFSEIEAELAQARDEIAKLRTEMSKLPQSETVAARYPTNSMCASGHQMVLWMDDDFGPCPVCAIIARAKKGEKQ